MVTRIVGLVVAVGVIGYRTCVVAIRLNARIGIWAATCVTTSLVTIGILASTTNTCVITFSNSLGADPSFCGRADYSLFGTVHRGLRRADSGRRGEVSCRLDLGIPHTGWPTANRSAALGLSVLPGTTRGLEPDLADVQVEFIDHWNL